EESSPGSTKSLTKKEICSYLKSCCTANSFCRKTNKPIDLLIIGGSKLDTKIGLVKTLTGIASNIFLGGLLGTPFYSNTPTAEVEEILECAMQTSTPIFLPTDYLLEGGRVCKAKEISTGKDLCLPEKIRDIGPESISLLQSLIGKS